VLRRQDAWAYTPEHRALLTRAHLDSREGRVREISEDGLKRLGSSGLARGYRSLDLTDTFLETFASNDFTASDRVASLKALRLLDNDEHHPSLRVHKLEGDREGSWTASASGVLRLAFQRIEGGRKRLLTCSKHYDR